MMCYQNILNGEFLKRSSKNASYSMRSFARDIGLSQSFLSLVLNQKRKLSDEMGIQLAEKLKLDRHSKKLFINLVRLEHVANPEVKKILQSEINKQLKNPVRFKLLTEDIFNIVADWSYFAILELTCLENFKSDPVWIAKKLRISVPEVKRCIERLQRVGLLQDEDGVFRKTQKDYLFENVPSAAIRKHHRDTLVLAQKALIEQDMSQREYFTICFPMDPAMMAKAKKRIKDFASDLMEEMQESKPKSVYKVAVQMFRLDQETP